MCTGPTNSHDLRDMAVKGGCMKYCCTCMATSWNCFAIFFVTNNPAGASYQIDVHLKKNDKWSFAMENKSAHSGNDILKGPVKIAYA